jgi:L-gulonolactone oxidase
MIDFHERSDVLSWGRAHRVTQAVARPAFADQLPELVARRGARRLLARGCGRSYGDSNLNADNAVIDMTGLDHVLAFDTETGILEAESGVTLRDILALTEDRGGRWFLPVTPGTKYVTLGGAIANDVHGKNHHSAGCFGNHVLSLQLLRSDGSVLTCAPAQNTELFQATIGGLGLTGIILSARIALKAVPGPWFESEDIRFDDLAGFYELSRASADAWEYTVAWIDCFAAGRALGRGLFSRARHAVSQPSTRPGSGRPPRIALPLPFPAFALSAPGVIAFNAVHWRQAAPRRIVSPDKALYPLDSIGRWNLMYGRRGFYQYQCVVPQSVEESATRALLEEIQAAHTGSFLAVLKTFGDRPSPGMLSFPMPGTTLALDFPNRGEATLRLMDRLDRITHDAGGRVYAAKDGRVSAQDFQRGYPAWRSFADHVDPGFSSSFWRRVAAETLQ